MGQPLTIVTSQWPIVPTGIYGRMLLRSARVEGIYIAKTCEALSCLAHDFITFDSLRHTGRPKKSYTFWVNLFVYFTYHFRTPVFQHGALLVHVIVEIKYMQQAKIKSPHRHLQCHCETGFANSRLLNTLKEWINIDIHKTVSLYSPCY